MEQEKLFQKIAQILDLDEENISTDYILSDEGWDSLELMSIAAAVDEIYDIVISVSELSDCKNVGDILLLIEKEKATNEK